ncbi:VOC family protein [Allosphingosinicella indica]|uniref:Catechol 2,3-dioxygenase n=1 Tax=Allosphingosinicella indica TaxID=941907 RepID=A0A1X7FZL8_9SPHN|nr:VOC family protein [Allosphingosinicella indica]SMF61466.1 Catechol 2,3-dioxygenase [Allosphingosinicella indica]
MYSHMMIGSNDLDRSRRFYDALFGAMGAKPVMTDEKGRLMYLHNRSTFMVAKPLDGKDATVSNGATIGFTMDSPEAVHRWHDAGVAAGGTSIEDPPGVRSGSFGQLYLAYLRDPDGNKLCALHRVPKDKPAE